MAITILSTTAKNSQLSALSTSVGAGGTIEVQTSGGTVLAIMTGATYGTPSAGSMTVTATADSSNDATGTGDKLVFKTSGGTAIFSSPIADLTFSPSTTVTALGTATLTTFTLTA